MDDLQKEAYREMVEAGGGIFTGIQHGHQCGDIVLFQYEKGGSTIGLYAFALRSVEDVRLAIRSKREQMSSMWVAGGI